jgi:hypothetical protein
MYDEVALCADATESRVGSSVADGPLGGENQTKNLALK